MRLCQTIYSLLAFTGCIDGFLGSVDIHLIYVKALNVFQM